MPITEQEYLAALRAHAADTRSLLSNERKTERECMVVRATLRCLGVPFDEVEIMANPEENSDVDVFFRSAQFQVKEITGGRKRSDEWREKERRWQDAQSIEEIGEPWIDRDPVSFERAVRGITAALGGKVYADRSDLDAVAYVNLETKVLRPPSSGDTIPSKIDQQGWRSVTMLFPPYAIVLTATADAPDFLGDRAGRFYETASEGLEGLFEA